MHPSAVFTFLFVCLAGLTSMKAKEINEEVFRGVNATRGQLPFMALTYVIKDTSYLCGATLISDSWILTAAHCADGADKAVVELGIIDKRDTNGSLVYTIEESSIYVHPEWDFDTARNDIALYKLPSPVPFDKYPYIKPVGLPKKSEADPKTVDGKEGLAAGWGTINDQNEHSKVLQYTMMRVLGNQRCEEINTELKKEIPSKATVTDGNICLDRNTTTMTGVCKGDSGGPFVIKNADGKWVEYGITSFEISRNCETTAPNVMTYLPHFLDWVEEVTKIKME